MSICISNLDWSAAQLRAFDGEDTTYWDFESDSLRQSTLRTLEFLEHCGANPRCGTKTARTSEAVYLAVSLSF
jgi:hypothetical protein